MSSKPAIWSRVLFPLPDCPITATNSPSDNVNDTLSTAVTLLLYILETFFNSIDLNEIELSKSTREYLFQNPAAAALFEYACLTNDKGEQVYEKLEKQINHQPLSELFGLVAVTNAEKVILERIQEKQGQIKEYLKNIMAEIALITRRRE